jgi:hypothetical protein
VTLASGFKDDADALPIRTDARVLGATLKAGETARPTLGQGPQRLPGAGRRRDRSQRRQAERPRRRGHQGRGRVTVTALEDAELVLVDAA